MLQTSGKLPDVWRSYEEVFDFARLPQGLVVGTNGGLLTWDGKNWSRIDSPSGIRFILDTSPLTVSLADSKREAFEGGRWQIAAAATSRDRTLQTGLTIDEPNSWATLPLRVLAPPATPYCVEQDGSLIWVGTNDGLYRLIDGAWARQTLPSDMPVTRPNGLALSHGSYVIGGLGGLYVGQPNSWAMVSKEAVRQVLLFGDSTWVVYGSGAVDKLESGSDKLYPDVFFGAARRPWTSCADAIDNDKVLAFGGNGGWIERGKELEDHYPKELDGEVVTAIEGRGQIRWIGTQASGLFRFDCATIKRWNPGNGLTDPWVTGLLNFPPKGLIVGTATKGLFCLNGDSISAIASPSKRITRLFNWNGELVVGGMDGAWVQEAGSWRELKTDGEETTSLTTIGAHLAITTASGVHFFDL